MKLLKKRGFYRDFKTRVFIKFLFLIIAVSAAFTFVFIQHERTALSDTLVKNGLALANLFAYSSRLGAFSENPYFFRDPVEGLAKMEEVSAVFVYAADGRLLNAGRGREEPVRAEQKRMMEKLVGSRAPDYFERTDHFEFWAPIFSGAEELSGEALFYGGGTSNQKNRVIGFVRIDVGKKILEKSFRSLMIRSLLIVAIFLTVSSVIAYLLARRVTRPLNQLTEGVRAIEKGRLALPVPSRTNDEIGVLTTAFNTMAKSLREREKQLRSLMSRLSLIEEKERRRIATDLHDNLGQTLAVSKMKLGTLKEAASSADAVEAVNKVRELIDEAICYTRTLTSELSPQVLYSFGFVAAVEWLVEQFRREHDIPFEFTDDGEQKPMDEETQILLFRVTRELLFNVAKHSRARSAKVSTVTDGDNIRIAIEDDGVGFDASAVLSRVDSFGLFSIRERLKYLGGRLDIQSAPGRGTRVVLSALLKRQEG